MDIKSDIINQEINPKPKHINNNLDDNTSDIHSINKIFSNANSIIAINVTNFNNFNILFIG